MTKLACWFAAAIILAGCATTMQEPTCTPQVGDVGYLLADKLQRGIGEADRDKVVIVGSIVNLDEINEVPSLGRLVGEHLGSRLAQHGIRIAEPRLRGVLAIGKAGEYVLSRDAKDLASKTNAYAFVTGTVSKMQGRYYFNARMVRVSDSQVLAAYDVCLTGKVREAGL